MQSMPQDDAKAPPVIKVLHLEDNAVDGELVQELLRDSELHCEITRVSSRAEFESCLEDPRWHVILADLMLPAFDGLTALRITKQICPATPFLFVTGTMGEENAIESLKNGATDYVLKQNMARLAPAVRRALKEREETLRRMKAESDLQKSERQLRIQLHQYALRLEELEALQKLTIGRELKMIELKQEIRALKEGDVAVPEAQAASEPS